MRLLLALLFFCCIAPLQAQSSEMALDLEPTDYIQLQPLGNLNFSAPATLEFWVKPKSDASTLLFGLGRNGSVDGDWFLELGPATSYLSNEMITILQGNGTRFGYVSTNRSQLFDGDWHHVAVVCTGAGTTQIYLDGVLKPITVGVGSQNGNFGGGASVVDASLGSVISKGNRRASGNAIMDEVRIWNRVLTQDEIRHKMCEQLTGLETGLVAYYRMDEGVDNTCSGGEDVCDASGNGNHGTKF